MPITRHGLHRKGRLKTDMKIKICGIATVEEALAAADMGADMLGFNFYSQSVRYIHPDECARIQENLIKHNVQIRTVGVFVDATAARVEDILNVCNLDLAQLHGDEPPELINALGDKAFKALRPRSLQSAQRLVRTYAGRRVPPVFLVDAYHPASYGGGGRTGNWEVAHRVAKQYPTLLAGGLNPNNVAEAIERVAPWGVDVASGVESAPGKKDVQKVKEFIDRARRAGGRISPDYSGIAVL